MMAQPERYKVIPRTALQTDTLVVFIVQNDRSTAMRR